jgi:hypothetical protein
VLTNLFPHGKNLIQASTNADGGSHGPPFSSSNPSTLNVYMLKGEAHIASRAHHYRTQITKTSQQEVKNKEKWTRGELTEPRCRALKKSHVATLAEVRCTQVCLVRSDIKQSYSKNDYTEKKDKIQKKFHQ